MKEYFKWLAAGALALGLGFAATPKDTFVHMTFGEVDTLDPAQAYDTASGYILENIYETLYTYKGDSLTQFEPLLATGYEVSNDGKTYTFYLRKGVQFHSGNTMTCKDVEYSIQRLLVTNPGDSAGWFFAESLVGYDVNAKAAAEEVLGKNPPQDKLQAFLDEYWQKIDNSVECDGLYTVKFNLVKPDPSFFVKLMYTAASVIDSKWAIENGDWSGTKADWEEWIGKDLRQGYLHNHASGTGPYKLVKWDGKNVVAEAFDGYWGKKPAIKKVLVQVVNEQSTRIEALKRGDADRITINDRATLESQVRGLPGVKVWEDPKWAPAVAGAIFFNFDPSAKDNPYLGSGKLDGKGVPPNFFDDIHVRKAFAYSIDQDAIIEDLYLGKGVKLTMALPPSFLGYDPNLPIYNYDPDKAEAHFKKAFGGKLWKTGFEITILYNEGNTVRQTIAEMLKANIEELNPKFKINVKGVQWPDFIRAVSKRQLPIFVLGWGADYADPDNFIYTFYHSRGYYGNKISFKDDQINKWIEEARSITDSKKRAELYAKIGKRGYELVPFVPYPLPSPFIVTRSNIKGVYYNPMRSGAFLWKDIVKE